MKNVIIITGATMTFGTVEESKVCDGCGVETYYEDTELYWEPAPCGGCGESICEECEDEHDCGD